MNAGGVEKPDWRVLLLDQQADFRAAEDHTVGTFSGEGVDNLHKALA